MKFTCITDLAKHLQDVFAVPSIEIRVERPPENMAGDIVVNCFRLAKPLRRSPTDIAAAAAEFLAGHDDTVSVQCIKAYVNIELVPRALFLDTVADASLPFQAGRLGEAERKRMVVEFSAPNTNKPQHLGHVRNNTLGQALVLLLRRAGHEVAAVNLVNDRGIHICKSMLAYQRFNNGDTPQGTGRKGDHLVGDYYVRYDQEYRKQVAALRQSSPELSAKSDTDLFLETEIGRAAQEMLVQWEAGEPEVRELWQTMNQWVMAGFDETYQRLGVSFDKVYLESETYGEGKEIIQQFLEKGVFEKRSDGAVMIDLDPEKLGQKVVLRSDGTSVYVTQDLGTTLIKQGDFEPHKQIWVVGDEQIHHFKVLFAILRRLGFSWAQSEEALCHMAYGMVNLPSGKMKSREGTVVDADDLLDEMESLARTATAERYSEVPDDLAERARAIGLGALKYMLLKVNPKTTIMFDPEASLKFEGDTGPYIMYAYARISSMLRKAGERSVVAADMTASSSASPSLQWETLTSSEEKGLALACAAYGKAIEQAAADLDTSILAGYLLDLAKAFSRFYRECPVLNAESDALRETRLELGRRVRDILGDGLHTLGIGVLENM